MTQQQQKELTERGKRNINSLKESIAREQEYITFEDGEERTLHFDAEKMREAPGKFGTRYEFNVVDLNRFPDLEKKWTVSKTNAMKIMNELEAGNTILRVKAEGEGIDRRYKISAK
jgi:hypothetical protein